MEIPIIIVLLIILYITYETIKLKTKEKKMDIITKAIKEGLNKQKSKVIQVSTDKTQNKSKYRSTKKKIKK